MLFNSFQFLIFFPVVTVLYFLLPHRYRWLHLLLASCIFYMAFIPAYILILFFTIIIDYIAGIVIEGSTGKRRKLFLIISIVANVAVLSVFKYYNFFIDNVNSLLATFDIVTQPLPYLGIILPIGLSFHTFQAMSYTIEVYRGHQRAERHAGIYALYVMFYPQLVAGPIERPQNILHQFHEKKNFDYQKVVSGLKLMLWGMFMKVVIADRAALYVDPVYNNIDQHNGTTLLIATLLFSFQIYCDFAGYSYIAIGAARVMGIKLMTNFNHPYFAASIPEFWRRWHISLSTWFRDYVYIPLGGNRCSLARWQLNLLITFLISGIWHGANWTFVVWGALHGIFQITSNLRKRYFGKNTGRAKSAGAGSILSKLMHILLTFLLVSFAWIFFRATTISDAFLVVNKIFMQAGPVDFLGGRRVLGMAVLGVFILLTVEIKREYFPEQFKLMRNRRPLVRYATYITMVIIMLLFGVFDGAQFIYFQF